MKSLFILFVIFCAAALAVDIEAPNSRMALAKRALLAKEKPNYDHQVTTYNARFQPVYTNRLTVSLTPFFSPDHSVDTHVEIINNAQKSVDVMIPSFSSWNGCTFGTTCQGCFASGLRKNETFPVWQALVNAIHRGVKVRVLTNNYEDKVCHMMMTPLIYLQLAGAQVNYYRTTAFTHVKYVNADNLTSAVSSINYSKTSFIHNREAGIVIGNDNSGELIGFLQAVYEYDWKVSSPFVLPYNYTAMDYEIVNDKRPLPITPPNYPTYKCKVASPAPVAIHGRASVKIITSPDYAFDNTILPLQNVSKSLWVSIYQITDNTICDLMIQLSKRIDLRIFVSDQIYAQYDAQEADKCYKRLHAANVRIRKSAHPCLTYSHEKFWIIDGSHVFISTGNWSPTDYPQAYVFPPYGSANYVKANRDFTVAVWNAPEVIQRYTQVFENDYAEGHDYAPAQ